MRVTQRVKKILSLYESDNPGTKTNLARMLMEGKLGGSGRIIMLPLQPLAEAENANWCNLDYHIQMAVDGGFSAAIMPRQLLEQLADAFAGSIPAILHSEAVGDPADAVRAALTLGCVGIAADLAGDETHAGGIATAAKAHGLVAMLCLGGAENAADLIGRANRAVELGAHIVCAPMPDHSIAAGAQTPAETATISDRVRHIQRSCAQGRRMVLFAATATDEESILNDIRAVRDGGGTGYMLPASSLHRPYEEVVQLSDMAVKVYQGKA